MKLEIEIPEPAFRIRDVVRRPNSRNDKAFIYRIVAHRYAGEWRWTLVDPPEIGITSAYYVCKPLAGSVYNNRSADPYKPFPGPDTEGVHVISMADMEQRQELLPQTQSTCFHSTIPWRPDPQRAARVVEASHE